MKNTLYRFGTRLALAGFLTSMFVTVASAQINFTFANANPAVDAGSGALAFNILLTNGAQISTIDYASFSIPGLNYDQSSFENYLNNTAPDPFPTNYSYNLTAFSVDVPLNATPMTYTGTADIYYTSGGNSFTVSQPFSVEVDAKPEMRFDFANSSQATTPGGEAVAFTGDFVNGSYDTTIVDFSFTMDTSIGANGITLDTTPFETLLNNAPDPIPAQYSLSSQTFFTASVAQGTASGDYSGTALIEYTSNGTNYSVSHPFYVTVPAVVPEAGTGLLILFTPVALLFRSRQTNWKQLRG